MKNMVKMTLVITVLSMVSAGLLTGVNMLTAPVIEANLHRVLFETIEEYFPEFETVEEVGEEEPERYRAIYGPDEELLGYVVENVADGYEDEITYYTLVDEEGYIEGIEIVDHSETPGIGAEIEREDFQNQFVGKHYQDSFTTDEGIDIISGATVSSQAVIGSLRNSMQEMARGYFDDEEEDIIEVELAELPDGTFEGTAPGLNEGVKVAVTVESGKIDNIEIIEHEDTPDYFEEAKEEILQVIKNEQTLEVDTVSGATQSSYGIINAVEDALANGAGG